MKNNKGSDGRVQMNYSSQVSACLVAVTLVACGGEAPGTDDVSDVGQVQEALTDGSELAFVHAPFGPDYVDPRASFNSSGRVNTVITTSPGHYQVSFPGVGKVGGGHVQLSSIGHDICAIERWVGYDYDRVQVDVACYERTGEPSTFGFSAAYFARSGADSTAQGGYLYAHDPNNPSYTAVPYYSWNSAGLSNYITRESPGTYDVFFAGLSSGGGTVQVTAYGSVGYCNVGYWGPVASSPVGAALRGRVLCFDVNGAPQDSLFTAAFSDGSPEGANSYAYAWGSNPWASSYAPNLSWQKASSPLVPAADLPPNTPITIARQEPGVYVVSYPSIYRQAAGSRWHTKVTAYGGNARCTIWYQSQTLVVCTDAAGTEADSYFVITHAGMP